MKYVLACGIFLLMLSASCGTSAEAKTKYQCPMKCEGEKTYDSAGKCPQCQMDLKEVK